MACCSSLCFLLLSPLLLLLLSGVNSGRAPAPTTTDEINKPQKFCQGASDKPSCVKVPLRIQTADEIGKISDLCLHFAAKKTVEAKAFADRLLAAAKGDPTICLEACATNITSMANVLGDLPAKQDDMNAYLTAKNFRAKFKDDDPPLCEGDCQEMTSTADETLLASQFHEIWTVVEVANSLLELMFPTLARDN